MELPAALKNGLGFDFGPLDRKDKFQEEKGMSEYSVP